MKYPFLVPNPVRLSERGPALREIEESRWFSNYGPVNTRFEDNAVKTLFGGTGACVTVNNATIGLMLAIKYAVEVGPQASPRAKRKYAIMPSFTFAATAHAAMWCGLTPLLCDIDAETWLPSQAAILDLLKQKGEEVAVIVPYATFGNNLDLDWYAKQSKRTGIPIVVDAAASLGSYTQAGTHFGAGSSLPIVFSMHTTKTFSTSEAGVIYSSDSEMIANLRRMGNFGFDKQRVATLPGFNSKLSEIGALLCLEKLKEYPAVVDRRRSLVESYQRHLSGLHFQKINGMPPAAQFMPVTLPTPIYNREARNTVIQKLAAVDIEARTYFSPCIHEQPYFAQSAVMGPLAATEQVSGSCISLPLHDQLTAADVKVIAQATNDAIRAVGGSRAA